MRHLLFLLGRRISQRECSVDCSLVNPSDLDQILGRLNLMDLGGNRRYLLEKTQHIIGGFGKTPGDPPGPPNARSTMHVDNADVKADILHSYLGLAALSLMGEPGVKSLDPCLCISNEAKERLGSLPWRSQ